MTTMADEAHLLLSNLRDLFDSPVTDDFRTASVSFLITALHRSYLLLSSRFVRENADVIEKVLYTTAAILVLRTYLLSRSSSAGAMGRRRQSRGISVWRLYRTALALCCVGLAALVGWYHEVHVDPADAPPSTGVGDGETRFTIDDRGTNYGTFPTDEAVRWARGMKATKETERGGDDEVGGDDPFAVYPLQPRGEWFVEKGDGRRVAMIRAINLSGGSKLPARDSSSPDYDPRDISFVGRPFPIGTPSERADASTHLARIRSYGFNTLRLIVTWEAIEHSGPGIHDAQYLGYIREIVRLCREFSLGVIVDFHQDVWSRATGGDGAPSWTLDAVGFDVPNLFPSGAAVNSDDHPDVKMLWPTNYARLAPATMFALFFAGDVYAPRCQIDGMSAQRFLRRHYLDSVKVLAETLRDEPNVIGYDTLNEPSTGYVGSADLRRATFPAPMGWHMSAFTSMMIPSAALSEGKVVPVFGAPFVLDRMEVLNPTNVSAWRDPIRGDVWRNEGVWDLDGASGEARLVRPQHFALNGDGQPVDFVRDYMVPFFREFANVVRGAHPGVIIFAEPHIDPSSPVHDDAPLDLLHPGGGGGGDGDGDDDQSNNYWAWAPHYYDASTLLLKDYRPWFFLDYQSEHPVLGERNAREALSGNLAHVRRTATATIVRSHPPPNADADADDDDGPETEKARRDMSSSRSIPVIVGEIGIPMDMHSGASFVTGDYFHHVHALDRSIGGGLESNLLSYALWNYSPDNDNESGDGWNGEDLSIYSNDQRRQQLMKLEGGEGADADGGGGGVDIYAGGRAIEAAVRPYPMLTCGTPVESHFDPLHPHRPYRLAFETTSTTTHDTTASAVSSSLCGDPGRFPTVVFVPRFQYPNGLRCVVSDGSYQYDREGQLLTYVHDVSVGVHTLTIVRS